MLLVVYYKLLDVYCSGGGSSLRYYVLCAYHVHFL